MGLTAVAVLCGSTGTAASAAPGAAPAAVAFVRPAGNNGSIWVADASGGEQRRLGPGEFPLISPDGRYVAADTKAGLVVYRTSGGVAHTFSVSRYGATYGLAWSPSSRYLAIQPTHPDSVDIFDFGSGKIVTAASGTGGGSIATGHGTFAPTGTARFVTTLAAGDHATGSLYALSPHEHAPRPVLSGVSATAPIWTAGGIYFDASRSDGEGTTTIDRDSGGRAVRVSGIPGNPDLGYDTLVGARGGHAFFVANAETPSHGYLVQAATGHAQAVGTPTALQETITAISSDGTRLLIERRSNGTLPNELVTMPATGGKQTVLVQDAIDPSWNR